jgi:lysophospholipase L1-like esterase
VGRGIGGQVTSQMLVRFRADVINLKPKAVVILAGTNDIAQNNGFIKVEHIFENIVSMTELAKANKMKVVICSVLPATVYSWRKEIDPIQPISELNSKLKEYAIKNKIAYADYFSVMVDERQGLKKEYQNDEVHPNKAGYVVMEEVIQKVLKKVIR